MRRVARGHRVAMRIAITGASGNVGSAVVDRLLEDGHELVGIVRRPPALIRALRWATSRSAIIGTRRQPCSASRRRS